MSTSDYTDTQPTPQDAQQAILSPITKALKDNNITLDRLSSKINDLIDCTRPAGADQKGQAINTPDNPSQIKAVDMALKLQQAYPAERKDININPVEQLTDKELDERIEAKLRKNRSPETPIEAKTEAGEG